MLPPKHLVRSPVALDAALAASIWRWLIAALPSWRVALAGSLVWAIAMAASAALALWLDGWETPSRIGQLTLVYALGGALAFAPALYLARLLSRGRRDAGFAAAFLSFSVGSIGFISLIFALHYRLYYATWHGEAFSLEWIFQFIFTTLASLYQFLVLGVRLFFPLGLAAVFAVSLWHARAER